MHPYRLHATAASWSLRNARKHLATAAEQEAAAISAEMLNASDGIRSWVPTLGRGGGGHGDPASGAALAGFRPPRVNRHAQLAEATTTTLAWLAGQLGGELGRAHPHPLSYLRQLLPTMQPGTAATLYRWLVEYDERIRSALGIGPDRERLGGVPCPSCSARRLVVLTAAPDRAFWSVVCETGCLCTGAGCGCGMAVRLEGVAHIWPCSQVIAQVASAAA